MKNVSIFHGTDGTPDLFWFPYLKKELEKQNYRVWVPQLPQTEKPDLNVWLPFVINNEQYDQDSILVGHSAGCPLILSLLEKIDYKIKLAILVAGFSEPLSEAPEPILQKSYDWRAIKSHIENIIFINSNNDPWGCDDKAGRKMFDQLGGTLIIRDGEGHMGSTSFNQPYKEFPMLLALISGGEKSK